MSGAARQGSAAAQTRVSFSLLEREYVLACPEEERQLLLDAVDLVREKMKEVRQGGNVIGGERIAVMAALHLAYEFLDYKGDKECYTETVDSNVRSMLHKVQAALGAGQDAGASSADADRTLPEADTVSNGA